MTLFAGLEHIVRDAEPLAPHTWFRLGGAADYFAEPTSHEELAELIRRCRGENMPMRLLGGGSNVLVRDAGFAGLVLRLSAPAFCDIRLEKQAITAGGGALLRHVVSTAVREGLTGLELLVGIPGTLGGALHGNASVGGDDIGAFVERATVITEEGELIDRRRDELRFAYRHSSLDELVIVDARFTLEKDDPAELMQRMQMQWIVKRAKQPLSGQNTGLIFKDAGGQSAASLIEQAGLKGTSVGQVALCDVNSNFIVAHQGATSDEVVTLIEQLKQAVADRLGVELETVIDIW